MYEINHTEKIPVSAEWLSAIPIIGVDFQTGESGTCSCILTSDTNYKYNSYLDPKP